VFHDLPLVENRMKIVSAPNATTSGLRMISLFPISFPHSLDGNPDCADRTPDRDIRE
jgi:hypothetical protein